MIEWSKVASDINKYTKSVFREDGQTITDSELEDALTTTYCRENAEKCDIDLM